MHPNETGQLQQYKIPLHVTVKAHFIRFIANVDALVWMLGNKIRK